MKNAIVSAALLSVVFSVCEVLAGGVLGNFSGELVRKNCADPWILRNNGKFYLTRTGTSRILVEEADRLNAFTSHECRKTLAYDSSADRTVKELGFGGVNGTWSPEIHYFSDDDFPGYAGWFLFLALRDSAPGDSSHARGVVLKSLTDSPAGPYGHPVTGERFTSQPLLNRDGYLISDWVIGQSALRIHDGQWKGVYGMFVTEKKRGTRAFHQEIHIARLKTPWQLNSDFSVMTVPAQHLETIGSGPSKRRPDVFLPKVVEGATAVYGIRGDVYVIYSGSGYWSNYGLGQLTWTGGDPLKRENWVKYDGNPVFGAGDADGKHIPGLDLQGIGHASFFTDADGKRLMVFHAYPFNASELEKEVDGVMLAPRQKAKARNAYVLPWYLDYSLDNGASVGVFRAGDISLGKISEKR
ncbi:MAG: family 43 glycosylhydrolase [Thermoguttaceae bacterium]|nr:family 43 glycosylhydrolase [Thermoguttaceae bacterium]